MKAGSRRNPVFKGFMVVFRNRCYKFPLVIVNKKWLRLGDMAARAQVINVKDYC